MSDKIGFFSVVYPSVEQYLEDYFDCLDRQTFRNFDIFIVNDGIKRFADYKAKYKELQIIDLEHSDTIPKIREWGINQMIDAGYNIIVFGDADDYYSYNRIEIVVRMLEHHDIVVNDIDLVDEDGRSIQKMWFSERLDNLEIVTLSDVKDRNLFGLSNTGIRTDGIHRMSFDDELIAVDWFFFASLLFKGYRAVFTNETTSFYRQHALNTIGMSAMNSTKVLTGLRAKVSHYRNMAKLDEHFAGLHRCFEMLLNRASTDGTFLEYYLGKIKRLGIVHPFWWEEIRLLEEFDESEAH